MEIGSVIKVAHNKKALWFIVITLPVFVALPTVIACPISLPTMDVIVGNARLKLEIAATPEARECGLSRRDTLPPDHGMLFVVPKPIILDFWMAETDLPLSIAFLNESGKIMSIQDMMPDQPKVHFRSPAPARYAIEVNQGWFAEHKVGVGDVIEVRLPVMFLVR